MPASGGAARDLLLARIMTCRHSIWAIPMRLRFLLIARDMLHGEHRYGRCAEHQRRSIYGTCGRRKRAKTHYDEPRQRLGTRVCSRTGNGLLIGRKCIPGWESDRWRLMLYDREKPKQSI